MILFRTLFHVIRAVISVVVLQNRMDLLKGELGSCSEMYVMSTHESNEVTTVKVDSVTEITEEVDQEPTTIPVIKTEPRVSCVSVVSVTHISYRIVCHYISLSL